MHMLDLITRSLIAMLLISGLLAACDKQVDVRSGDRAMQLTLPGTRAHGARLEARVQECLRWNPPSLCDQRHPGARSDGGPVTDAAAPEAETPADPSEAETRP